MTTEIKGYKIEPGANLKGANLHYADLKGEDLSNADLRDVDLSWAKLSGANLSNADLSGASLSNADLSEANLSNADLSEANLRRTFRYGANFTGAKGIESAKGISEKALRADHRAGYLTYEKNN